MGRAVQTQDSESPSLAQGGEGSRTDESDMPSDDRRALVVDDNAHMRFMSAEILKALGFTRVDAAADVATAGGLAEAHTYAVLLVDLQLDGESGLDLVRRLRQRPGPRLPVLVFSGIDLEQGTSVALAAGADGYVVKPFSIRSLADALQALPIDATAE